MFLLLVHSSEREGTGSVAFNTMQVGWEVVPYARSLSGVSKPGSPCSVC